MSEYSNIIEEIHAKYVGSGEELLAEVATLTKEGGREAARDQEEDVKSLKDIGFENFAQAKVIVNVEERIEQLQHSVEDSATYARKYPLYKFITESAINRINAEYNLRFGRAQSFVGDIPVKNQKEIIQAEKAISKADRVGLAELEWRLVDRNDNVLETIPVSVEEIKAAMKIKPAGGSLDRLRKGLASTMGIKTPTMAETWQENKHLAASKWLLVRDKKTIEGSLATRAAMDGLMVSSMQRLVADVGNKFLGSFVFITAPLDEFEGPSSAVVEDLEVSETVIELVPDPLVLYEVKTTSKERGFLIASAWGDEASDADVVNENFD